MSVVQFVEQADFLTRIGTALLFHATKERSVCLVGFTQLRLELRNLISLLSHRAGLRQDPFEIPNPCDELWNVHA